MYVAKSMLLLLFFSTVEAAMCLICIEHAAHCMWLRADMSSPLLIFIELWRKMDISTLRKIVIAWWIDRQSVL